jgi:hypothetical protein
VQDILGGGISNFSICMQRMLQVMTFEPGSRSDVDHMLTIFKVAKVLVHLPDDKVVRIPAPVATELERMCNLPHWLLRVAQQASADAEASAHLASRMLLRDENAETRRDAMRRAQIVQERSAKKARQREKKRLCDEQAQSRLRIERDLVSQAQAMDLQVTADEKLHKVLLRVETILVDSTVDDALVRAALERVSAGLRINSVHGSGEMLQNVRKIRDSLRARLRPRHTRRVPVQPLQVEKQCSFHTAPPAAAPEDIEEDLVCPITLEAYVDPVLTTSGQTYERRAIEAWLSRCSQDPLTGQELESTVLVPNHALRRLMMARGAS